MQEEKKLTNATFEKIVLKLRRTRRQRSKLLQFTTVFTTLSSQGFCRKEKESSRSDKQKPFLSIGNNIGEHTLPNHIFCSVILTN